MVPGEETWIRMGKDVYLKLGQLVEVEMGLGLDFNMETM